MNSRLLQLVVAFFVFAAKASAAYLTYQPSPYRGKDSYFSSVYHTTAGVDGGELKVGGWGDWYWSPIQFDLKGLPANPTQVILYMWAYSANDGSTPVSMNAYALTNDWGETAGWSSWNGSPITWSGYSLGTIAAPTSGQFNGIGFLSLYNQWKSGAITNKGFLFTPTANNNRFNRFYSSDHTVSLYRPYLYIQYTETVTPPSLKLPLPGNRSWVVTTEIGGWDEKYPGQQAPTHSGGNYFSIDFGPASSPSYGGDIPIYAAAGGKVAVVGSDQNHANGYYVVINHSNIADETTGYTTRYLHLKGDPSLGPIGLSVGDTVIQGQLLGYMGNTGQSDGTHLHFGVRYGNSGADTVNELTFVKLEGLTLKQYQTEVDSFGNRTSGSYFPSTNTP